MVFLPFFQMPKPLDIKSPQGDGPYTANELLKYQDESQKLWKRYSGNQHSFNWPDSDNAPTALMTVNNDVYYFSFSQSIFSIPWHVQNGFNSVRIDYIFGVQKANAGFQVATQSVALVDAVPSANITPYYPFTTNGGMPAGGWTEETDYYLSAISMTFSPNLPVSRVCNLRPFIKSTDVTSNTISTGFEIRAKIYSIIIRDINLNTI